MTAILGSDLICLVKALSNLQVRNKSFRFIIDAYFSYISSHWRSEESHLASSCVQESGTSYLIENAFLTAEFA